MTIILILLTSRPTMQETEKDQEGGQSEAPVSDSIPVTPGTSAQSAVVQAVIDNEELDHKESDSGLCHHNRVVIRLCATEISVI